MVAAIQSKLANHLWKKIAPCQHLRYPCHIRSERRVAREVGHLNVLQVVKMEISSRELTYPTYGKGKSSSELPLKGIC